VRRLLGERQRRSHVAWLLPLALVALPNCSTEPTFVSEPRITPGTALVPCDINLNEVERQCATLDDVMNGVRLAEAAVALVQGDTGKIVGIDDSPEALGRCSGGQPEAIVFQGEYPAGLPVCVDPAQVGSKFPTSTDVCIAKCLDLLEAADPPDPVTLDFCQRRAQASTNVPTDPIPQFGGGCTDAGQPIGVFQDPRWQGETVSWVNAIGVDTSTGNLVRNAPCAATPCSGFDAGAASQTAPKHGDGYVEFTVDELTKNRVGGLTTGDGADDISVDFSTIGFGIDFFRDGCFYVFENGAKRTNPTPPAGCLAPDAFGTYNSGDRFRITFTDNFDGTAAIAYAKLPGPCMPGDPCPAPPFYTSMVPGAFPLHVDAAFEDDGGGLLDVRLVYIH
jgi:hypothetical protein